MPSLPTACPWPIVELRQYTLHPGTRDVLIDLFDRHFIESQEAVGMGVLRHFRDLDLPDRFVWFRGFHDMASRGETLAAFYHGPVWKAHRDAANGTMIDSDNVLLLHEPAPGSGFATGHLHRPPVIARTGPPGLVVVTIYYLPAATEAAFADFFEHDMRTVVTRAGARTLATYITEHGANDFPALPIREGEHVFVWAAGFGDAKAHEAFQQALATTPRWTRQIQPALARRLIKPPETHRLAPAPRSLMDVVGGNVNAHS